MLIRLFRSSDSWRETYNMVRVFQQANENARANKLNDVFLKRTLADKSNTCRFITRPAKANIESRQVSGAKPKHKSLLVDG